MVHQFADKLREGMAHEATLDSVFRRMGYTVEPVGMDAQRKGVDRLMVSPGTRRVVRVEYKADSVASRTGNAFIETVSVDTANKPGWALSSQADWLLYYLPLDDLVYCIKLETLRQHLPRWQRQYRQVTAYNDGYQTRGIAVPLHELEEHAEQVLNLGDVA